MTKEQWTELMNDTNLPWPVIIDDTLKQYFTDHVADEVFDQILDAAWDRHLSLRHSTEKKPGRKDAIEILNDDPNVDAYVVITVGGDDDVTLNVNGTGKQLMALLISASAQFIHSAGDDVPDHLKAGIVNVIKSEFIDSLKTVLEDDDDD